MSKFLAVIAVIAFFWGGAPASAARDLCELPDELDTLIVGLQVVLTTPGRASLAQIARLKAMSDAIDREKVAKVLRNADLIATETAISRVLDDVNAISATGVIEDRARVEGGVRAALTLVRSVCAERGDQIVQDLKAADRLRQSGDVSGGLARLRTPPEGGGQGSFLVLSLLAPAIFGLVGAILLTRRLIGWFGRFAFTRRSCRIAAALEHDLDIVDGHIILISGKGGHFKPINSAACQQVQGFGVGAHLNLVIGHHSLPGEFDGLYGDVATFGFSEPLHDDFIEILMRASAIKPRYVRSFSSRPRSRATAKTMGAKMA